MRDHARPWRPAGPAPKGRGAQTPSPMFSILPATNKGHPPGASRARTGEDEQGHDGPPLRDCPSGQPVRPRTSPQVALPRRAACLDTGQAKPAGRETWTPGTLRPLPLLSTTSGLTPHLLRASQTSPTLLTPSPLKFLPFPYSFLWFLIQVNQTLQVTGSPFAVSPPRRSPSPFTSYPLGIPKSPKISKTCPGASGFSLSGYPAPHSHLSPARRPASPQVPTGPPPPGRWVSSRTPQRPPNGRQLTAGAPHLGSPAAERA